MRSCASENLEIAGFGTAYRSLWPPSSPHHSAALATGYFDGMGGAIFSGGAGGSAAFAPSFCACSLGRAGSGAGVVGRVPPGLDSAGASFAAAGADVCGGDAACATRSSGFALTTGETAVSASMAVIASDARRTSVPLFRSFDIASHRKMKTRGSTSGGKLCSRGNQPSDKNPKRTKAQSASRPASPSSAANASKVPSAFQASAAMAAPPLRWTRISAPSLKRTISTVPSP